MNYLSLPTFSFKSCTSAPLSLCGSVFSWGSKKCRIRNPIQPWTGDSLHHVQRSASPTWRRCASPLMLSFTTCRRVSALRGEGVLYPAAGELPADHGEQLHRHCRSLRGPHVLQRHRASVRASGKFSEFLMWLPEILYWKCSLNCQFSCSYPSWIRRENESGSGSIALPTSLPTTVWLLICIILTLDLRAGGGDLRHGGRDVQRAEVYPGLWQGLRHRLRSGGKCFDSLLGHGGEYCAVQFQC